MMLTLLLLLRLKFLHLQASQQLRHSKLPGVATRDEVRSVVISYQWQMYAYWQRVSHVRLFDHRTLAENLADLPALSEGQEIIKPMSDPIKSSGHLQVP